MASPIVMEESQPTRAERVPRMLQHVFLQSNRGKEVHKAPPQQQAHRTFFGNWIFRRGAKLDETKKKEYNKDKDKGLKKSRKEARKQQAQANTLSPPSSPSATKKTISSPPTPKPEPKPEPEYTIQEYFDSLLTERGYDIKLYDTLKTGYSNPSTPLQMASYGPRMVQIIKSSDDRALRDTLNVGLSPNPCNQFGESLLHMICRRGDVSLLNVMIEAGTSLQVCDDYGRTPLHDAFWAARPSYEVVSIILKRDPGLFFMKDRRGALPLSYVHKDHKNDWCTWFDEHIDEFFPEKDAKTYQPSELVLMEPGSMPSPDPKSELSLELVRMVASGEMNPEEARIMAETNPDDDTTVANTVDGDESTIFGEDDDSDFDSDSEYSSDDESDLDMDDDEMNELMQMAQFGRSSN
mmetsp:Transcript_3886/g.8328  ORF Transcript_3886/g.8328 Transcript_3886/m.8328 type:complete len:408 (-) Transcript_3886:189-1412(-)|eukprot:CAMPEP_0172450902 /NCGR_PEP_ID=MMETSP1065-20121228/9092_1 /TAXON_ID=265537 /ORGANISM="Amphiprora paludosa, Strain CCMP125" /LENGTH=407 /DNA_ID=CAMNT_0013202749 /DNA_START=507 /DNA_END=1730 /DNA_ORIENTATION=+